MAVFGPGSGRCGAAPWPCSLPAVYVPCVYGPVCCAAYSLPVPRHRACLYAALSCAAPPSQGVPVCRYGTQGATAIVTRCGGPVLSRGPADRGQRGPGEPLRPLRAGLRHRYVYILGVMKCVHKMNSRMFYTAELGGTSLVRSRGRWALGEPSSTVLYYVVRKSRTLERLAFDE